MNTADYLLQNAEDGSRAVFANQQWRSYGELKSAAARIAGQLLAEGIQSGDRVGILSENSLFWIASYLAVLKIGAVAVPLPTVYAADDLRRRERVVRCRAMCVDPRLWRKTSGAFQDELAVVDAEALSSPGPQWWGPADPCFDVSKDAALMLTSGTTAAPRAVRITHRNIQANTASIIQCLGLGRDDRMLVVLPFYYCFGTSLLHTHLRVGGSLTLCNTFAYPETALDMLEATKSTGLAGVPSTFQTLLRNTSFRARALPSLRKVQQAGGKLAPTLLRELMAAVPNARVYAMYGQTEATARLSCLDPEFLESKLGSIGRGIPGVTLRVLDDAGRDVRPGEVGEIVATGDNISPGYFEDADASAGKFPQGSLRSGDLGTVDEEGFIFIVDRKSDFIKSLGHRVSSQEIESKIAGAVDDVVGAAAIGEPDPLYGESITVFVTLRDGSRLSSDEVLQRCRAAMARHMVPKKIVVLDALPTNAHGKVMKHILRQEAGAGALQTVTAQPAMQ